MIIYTRSDTVKMCQYSYMILKSGLAQLMANCSEHDQSSEYWATVSEIARQLSELAKRLGEERDDDHT